jgi:hypothetical protein
MSLISNECLLNGYDKMAMLKRLQPIGNKYLEVLMEIHIKMRISSLCTWKNFKHLALQMSPVAK